MLKLPLRLLSVITLVVFLFSTLVTPVAAAMNYTYDANGSMLSDGTQCYEYNEANQLKKVKKCSNNQTIAEYVYDYQGNRIVKKEYENGTLKNTVYSPDDEFEKKIKASDNSVQNTTYYKANDEFLARKNPDGTKIYYHNDHLGSNTVLTDQSGNLVEKTAYEPYGEVKSGGTTSKFQYTGQEKDQETGLNYYGARYYASHIQRFTQADTILENVYDPQLLNRYSYVRNNPLRYTDPSGHCLGPAFFACMGLLITVSPTAASLTMYAVTHPDLVFGAINFAYVAPQGMEQIQSGDLLGGGETLGYAALGLKGFKQNSASGINKPVGKQAANSVINGLKLARDLAIKQQSTEKGKIIAGQGVKDKFRNADLVAKRYGGNPNDWVKKSSTSYKEKTGKQFETHWVENLKTGQRVDFKIKESWQPVKKKS